MLWYKTLHIAFMVTWFAGLFYLPRLFVYHAMSNDKISHDRFVIMERKLFGDNDARRDFNSYFWGLTITISRNTLWLEIKIPCNSSDSLPCMVWENHV